MLLALFVIAVLNWYETSKIKWLNKHDSRSAHMKLMTKVVLVSVEWSDVRRCCYDYIAIFEMAIMCNRKPNENGKRFVRACVEY